MVEIFLIWTRYFVEWRGDIDRFSVGDFENGFKILSRIFMRQFVYWQICSLLLAVAFLPYTYFFWNYVGNLGDQRYIASVITIHAIWGALWIFISMPLALTWYKLQINNLTVYVNDSTVSANGKVELEALNVMTISYRNALATFVTAVFTFVSPALKLIL